MKSISLSLIELTKENSSKPNRKSKNCKTYKIQYTQNDPNRFIFLIKCKENYSSPKGHIVSLRFAEEDIQSSKMKPLNSDVNLKCSCPAFLYWGSAYQSDTENYGDNVDEKRYPKIRDPFLENKVCKHISRIRFDLRNVTFKVLKKKSKNSVITSIQDIPTITIQECLSTLASTLERTLDGITVNKILSEITEETFEKVLEQYGVII